MSTPSAADLLKVQLRHAWTNARWVLEGIDEDEYFWEPVEGSWSLRPRDSGLRGWGRGSWVCEDAWPPPDPLPMTTIAWRVVHLAAWTEVYRDWTFGDASRSIDDYEVPETSAGGLASLRDAQDQFSADVDALDDDATFAYRPAHWGAQLAVARLVTLMITEHVHHIAEIGVLRGLHRGHARSQPPPPPVPGPEWWQPR